MIIVRAGSAESQYLSSGQEENLTIATETKAAPAPREEILMLETEAVRFSLLRLFLRLFPGKSLALS